MELELGLGQALLAAIVTLLVGSGSGGVIYALINRANVRSQLTTEREKYRDQLRNEREALQQSALEAARNHVDQQWMTLVDRLDQRNRDLSDKVAKQDKLIEQLQGEVAEQRRRYSALQHRQEVTAAEVLDLKHQNKALLQENEELRKQVRCLEKSLEEYRDNGR